MSMARRTARASPRKPWHATDGRSAPSCWQVRWRAAPAPKRSSRSREHVYAACARQPACRDAFPTVEQDFYAAYDDLTTSPVPVPIVRPDSGRDTVWLDGKRLVDDIRTRMLIRLRVGVARLPLLLHEL